MWWSTTVHLLKLSSVGHQILEIRIEIPDHQEKPVFAYQLFSMLSYRVFHQICKNSKQTHASRPRLASVYGLYSAHCSPQNWSFRAWVILQVYIHHVALLSKSIFSIHSSSIADASVGNHTIIRKNHLYTFYSCIFSAIATRKTDLPRRKLLFEPQSGFSFYVLCPYTDELSSRRDYPLLIYIV